MGLLSVMLLSGPLYLAAESARRAQHVELTRNIDKSNDTQPHYKSYIPKVSGTTFFITLLPKHNLQGVEAASNHQIFRGINIWVGPPLNRCSPAPKPSTPKAVPWLTRATSSSFFWTCVPLKSGTPAAYYRSLALICLIVIGGLSSERSLEKG